MRHQMPQSAAVFVFLLGYIVRVDLDQGMVELGSVRDREEY